MGTVATGCARTATSYCITEMHESKDQQLQNAQQQVLEGEEGSSFKVIVVVADDSDEQKYHHQDANQTTCVELKCTCLVYYCRGVREWNSMSS